MKGKFMSLCVGLNDFVKRQTPDSKYAHFNGTWEELVDLVENHLPQFPLYNTFEKNIDNGVIRKGYREGVCLLKVPPDRFFSSIKELKEGDKFLSIYKPRREGESPYVQSIYKDNKVPAKFVVNRK